MSEASIQKSIVQALRIALPHGWIVQATANKPRSMISGAIEKAMGTVSGWPDLALYGSIEMECDGCAREGARPFAGFMEVKTKAGRLSESQRACHDRLLDCGFRVAVVRSVDDALAAAHSWGLPLRIKTEGEP
jgi:hypothetical protein